jgi:predicted transcriptional regulator
MDTNLSADEVIDAFGGTAAVAKIFEISDAAVSQWRSSPAGIPKGRLMYLRLLKPELFAVAQFPNQPSKG